LILYQLFDLTKRELTIIRIPISVVTLVLMSGLKPAGCSLVMYICVCHGVTDRQICRAVDQGARSLGEVQMQLPVGACCGRCLDSAREVIHDHLHQQGRCPARPSPRVAEPALA
jgi:bacterioferritin-associated ferredoxin